MFERVTSSQWRAVKEKIAFNPPSHTRQDSGGNREGIMISCHQQSMGGNYRKLTANNGGGGGGS